MYRVLSTAYRKIMGEIKSFKELLVWKKSMDLTKLIYNISEKLPSSEKFCLIDQMRRASISIPSNIAEGFRRQHSREFRQFLCISRGSLAELETQLMLANDIYNIDQSQLEESVRLIDYVSRMIWNLIKRL